MAIRNQFKQFVCAFSAFIDRVEHINHQKYSYIQALNARFYTVTDTIHTLRQSTHTDTKRTSTLEDRQRALTGRERNVMWQGGTDKTSPRNTN